MPHWDADSPELRRNLARVLVGVRNDARRRAIPKVAAARRWQREMMTGLTVPSRAWVGRFRGERGLEQVRVTVGGLPGVAPGDVAAALLAHESRLQAVVARLDARYPTAADLDIDGLAAIIELAAWAHAEWVRIHPFCNGNGRTARLWANFVVMRYGIPPVIRLRPRPDAGYAAASASAMSGNWKPTAALFHELLRDGLQR